MKQKYFTFHFIYGRVVMALTGAVYLSIFCKSKRDDS